MNILQMSFRIVHGGAERVVVAGPKQIVAFERHWGLGVGRAMSEVRIEHLAWLAHAAALADAQTNGAPPVKPFDDWLEQLTDLEVVENDGAVPLDGTP
tara:strand:+ start:180 stop:473 length:294 start_codon:yes stop_codon:yes gene_type:complete